MSYLEVIDAQRTALAVERAATQLAAERLTASVALIKALGGGWNASAVVDSTSELPGLVAKN